MEYEVIVTRKGQTTIPASLNKKYNTKEGTRMLVREWQDGIVFTPEPSLIDLAGSGSTHAKPSEMKEMLDRLRKDF